MAEELIYKLNFEGADESTKNLAKLKKELADLTAKQKENKEALKLGTISQEEYYESQVKLEAETKSLKEATRQAETAYMANAKASAGAGMSIKQLSAELSKNKKAYQNLSKEERENDAIGGELLRTIQAQDAEYKELQVSIGNTQVMVGSYSDAIQSSLPLMGSFGGQIQSIIGTLGQVKEAFSKIGTVVGNQRTVVQGFGKSTQSTSNDINGMSASIGNATASTIGYSQAQNISNSATQSATASTIGFQRATQSATASTQAQAVATNVSSKSLKLFRIALIRTGIGAIVVALGSLIAAFASTQRGADAIARALAPVKEIFAVFVGFLQDKAFAIFDRLKEAINTPKQAFQDLLGFVKDVVINRFKGLQMFFEGWGNIFVGSWQTLGLKLKKVLNNVPIIGAGLGKEALAKLDKDIAMAKKKVTDGAQKMKKGLAQATAMDAVKEGFNKAGKAMDEATLRRNEMEKLLIKIRKSEITLNRDLERNRRKMEEQKLILENQLLPIEERNKAGKEYMRLLDENVKRESDISKMKLKHAYLSMKANDSDDEQKKAYYDMIAENERMLAEATGRRIEVQNKLNDFQKQDIQKQKEALKELEDKKLEALTKNQIAELEARKATLENNILTAEFEMEKQTALNEEYLNNKLFANRNNQKKLTEIQNEALQSEFERKKRLEEELYNLKITLTKEGAQEELKQKELELKSELDKELANEKNTLQIKKFLREQYEQELLDLKNQSLVAQNQTELEITRAHELNLLNLKNEFAEKDRQNKINEENKRKEKQQERVDAAQKVGDELFKADVRRIEATQKREIDSLTLRRQAGEISQEEYEKKRLQIEKDAFEKKKNLDIKQVLMNSAVAVSKMLSQGGAFSLPLLIALAAQTAGQIATIKAQKFRFGGNVGGKLHSQGGTMIEAEKGEAVIMREAVNPITAPILSAINTAYGGNPIEAIGQKNAPMQMQPQRIEVVNVATETTNIANRVKNLQNARRI